MKANCTNSAPEKHEKGAPNDSGSHRYQDPEQVYLLEEDNPQRRERPSREVRAAAPMLRRFARS